MPALAFNKPFFKSSSIEPRISHVLKIGLFDDSGSRVRSSIADFNWQQSQC